MNAVSPISLRMAESLREVHRVAQARGLEADGVVRAAEHLGSGGQLTPDAYADYFEVIRALQTDPNTQINGFLRNIETQTRKASDGVALRVLSMEDCGRVGARKIRAHFASESLTFGQMRFVPPSAHPRIRRNLKQGIATIKAYAPNAWADFSAITTEIVAAYGAPRNRMTFDGCSSLERFGSILINMRRDRSPLIMAETLVHESAHSLLFALSCNDHRVLNPASELYESPLRIDPRPLDGIYHAVFVLARMHGFLAEVALHPKSTSAMKAEARKTLKTRYENFMDGYTVLKDNALLTDIGQDLLDDAFERVTSAHAATT